MRHMVRKTLGYLSSKKWDQKLIKEFNKLLMELPLNINEPKIPDGVSYHLTDIYLEELGKCGDSLKPVRAVRMLQPFIKLLAISEKY